jgi:hypothetical protein
MNGGFSKQAKKCTRSGKKIFLLSFLVGKNAKAKRLVNFSEYPAVFG